VRPSCGRCGVALGGAFQPLDGFDIALLFVQDHAEQKEELTIFHPGAGQPAANFLGLAVASLIVRGKGLLQNCVGMVHAVRRRLNWPVGFGNPKKGEAQRRGRQNSKKAGT